MEKFVRGVKDTAKLSEILPCGCWRVYIAWYLTIEIYQAYLFSAKQY